MVLRPGVACCRVALIAYLRARCFAAGGVGIMAVGAGHTGVIHSALPERAPHIDLVLHLSIEQIESFSQQCRAIGIHERLPGGEVIGQLTAPAVASGAHLDLGPGLIGSGRAWFAGFFFIISHCLSFWISSLC